MAMNKNTVLAWATVLMMIMGVVLILLGAYRYDDVAGWGFATVGIGFFAIAWVFRPPRDGEIFTDGRGAVHEQIHVNPVTVELVELGDRIENPEIGRRVRS